MQHLSLSLSPQGLALDNKQHKSDLHMQTNHSSRLWNEHWPIGSSSNIGQSYE